jgi:hypothetical protein
MNSESHSDWIDLAGTWHAEAAQVSVDDIQSYLARRRREALLVTLAEFLVTALGVGAGLWLGLATRLHWMGLLIAAFALGAEIARIRARRRPEPGGTSELVESLRESIEYQDWLVHELRFGRALSFVALIAIVCVLSLQLRAVHATSALAFIGTFAAAVGVLAALVWNLVLARRALRQGARLRRIVARLAP